MRRSLLFFIIFAPLIGACQNVEGPCPEVTSMTPETAGSLETVEIRGSNFELGHLSLWDEDEGLGVPPTVFLDVSLRDSIPEAFEDMFTEEELAEMEAMDMTLQASDVIYVSAESLEVVLPELSWSDLETGATMAGSELPELPDFMTTFDLASTVRVVNPSECEGTWNGTFMFTINIEQEGE